MKIQPDVYLIACGYNPMPEKYEMTGWKEGPITEKQKKELEKYGIAYGRIKYKGQASMLLTVIYNRNDKHLATPKQIQVLLKNGYAINKVRYLTVMGASKVIKKMLPSL